MTQNEALEHGPDEAVTAPRDDVEVLPELAPRSPATAGAVPQRLVDLEAKVAAAISRGRAASTLRAYRSDWADFSTWCAMVGLEALPSGPGTVAAYVAELADPPDDRGPAAVSTITRRLAAIGEGHKVAGHPNPCTETVVRETMKGIRRMLGVAPKAKKAVSTADVRAAVGPLGTFAARHQGPPGAALRLRRRHAPLRAGGPRRGRRRRRSTRASS